MSKEKFPLIKPGDPLSAGRRTREGKVLSRFAQQAPGVGMSGHHGDSYVQFGVVPETDFAVLTITDVDTTVADPPIYHGTERHYNFQTNEWKDQTKKWRVDAKGLDLTLAVGDRVLAVWDGQRGMYVPASSGLSMVVVVEKDGGVSGGIAANCTWTYKITSLGGEELDTGLSPERARHSNIAYLEGAAGGRSIYGLAQRVSGSWVLFDVFGEIADLGPC